MGFNAGAPPGIAILSGCSAPPRPSPRRQRAAAARRAARPRGRHIIARPSFTPTGQCPAAHVHTQSHARQSNTRDHTGSRRARLGTQ